MGGITGESIIKSEGVKVKVCGRIEGNRRNEKDLERKIIFCEFFKRGERNI